MRHRRSLPDSDKAHHHPKQPPFQSFFFLLLEFASPFVKVKAGLYFLRKSPPFFLDFYESFLPFRLRRRKQLKQVLPVFLRPSDYTGRHGSTSGQSVEKATRGAGNAPSKTPVGLPETVYFGGRRTLLTVIVS